MKDSLGFFERVYQIALQIPFGRVTSYGAIAKFLGAPGSARMVGWAMNAAHGLSDVPAHRVVNRNGLLTGKMHFQTPTLMQELLLDDGINVKDDQIQNFDDHYWDPGKELAL